MSSWDYRVVRSVFRIPGADRDEVSFGLHETYYDDAGKPTSCTEDAVDVSSETVEGLRWVLDRMIEALAKPILEMKDFEAMPEGGPGG